MSALAAAIAVVTQLGLLLPSTTELPPVVASLLEKIVFLASYFASLLQWRLAGWLAQHFGPQAPGGFPVHPLTALAGAMLASPALWMALGAAAVVLVAVRKEGRA
jgi:hypothetical protein